MSETPGIGSADGQCRDRAHTRNVASTGRTPVGLLNLSQSVRIHRIGECMRVKLRSYRQQRTGYPLSWEREHEGSALRTVLLFESAPVALLSCSQRALSCTPGRR
jgi:hypothetical protein